MPPRLIVPKGRGSSQKAHAAAVLFWETEFWLGRARRPRHGGGGQTRTKPALNDGDGRVSLRCPEALGHIVCMGEVSKYRVYRDDLPAISTPRLRALGVITPEMTEYVVRLGHIEKEVSLHLRKFPSGGSWSWFGCPTCGKWVRTLRLLGDDLVCRNCCERRRVLWRAVTLSPRQRAERSIPKLRAMLESETPLLLKPSTLWGTMARRKRVEARLRECEFRVAQVRSPRRAVVDPCEEVGFSVSRPK
jgi:hypothetical protein